MAPLSEKVSFLSQDPGAYHQYALRGFAPELPSFAASNQAILQTVHDKQTDHQSSLQVSAGLNQMWRKFIKDTVHCQEGRPGLLHFEFLRKAMLQDEECPFLVYRIRTCLQTKDVRAVWLQIHTDSLTQCLCEVLVSECKQVLSGTSVDSILLNTSHACTSLPHGRREVDKEYLTCNSRKQEAGSALLSRI